MKPVIGVGMAALAFAGFVYAMTLYSIEFEREETTRMKICVEAKGSWLRQWNNIPYCQLPGVK